MRLEAVALIDGHEAGIGEKDGLVPHRFDRLSDTDGVECRAECCSGKNAIFLVMTVPFFDRSFPVSEHVALRRIHQQSDRLAGRKMSPLLGRHTHLDRSIGNLCRHMQHAIQAVIGDGGDRA
jgi:hypothetical protein